MFISVRYHCWEFVGHWGGGIRARHGVRMRAASSPLLLRAGDGRAATAPAAHHPHSAPGAGPHACAKLGAAIASGDGRGPHHPHFKGGPALTLSGRHLARPSHCTYFLKHIPCTNPDCMYLHELGDEAVSFTKEDVGYRTHARTHARDTRPWALSWCDDLTLHSQWSTTTVRAVVSRSCRA